MRRKRTRAPLLRMTKAPAAKVLVWRDTDSRQVPHLVSALAAGSLAKATQWERELPAGVQDP